MKFSPYCFTYKLPMFNILTSHTLRTVTSNCSRSITCRFFSGRRFQEDFFSRKGLPKEGGYSGRGLRRKGFGEVTKLARNKPYTNKSRKVCKTIISALVLNTHLASYKRINKYRILHKLSFI